MKLPALKNRKALSLGVSFAIPFIGMLIYMFIAHCAPFGQYSMLYSDSYYQYYPFFVAFRSALREGKGVLYSWSAGMGMDYLGLISYYLASPLNLLSVLVPEGLTLQAFSLLVPIKLGLAGLFFAIFLNKTFDRDDLSIALFGSFYALCAWALGYQWNLMWLDTFALLPLVALGTVSLLRDKRFILYTLTLFSSVFINYYIGFFTCIFVFLLFFCYEICRWPGVKRFIQDLFRIAVFSVLAIGMTAILELPALAALQNTYSSVNAFPKGFSLNIADQNTWRGLLDAMRQVAGSMGGGQTPTFKEGLPNLYCGVGSVLLAFLFLTSGEVKLRDKLCSAALLLFFMVSFIFRQLDYIWHGFHFTNMIPYRFSFLFSFVLLYMAYRAYLMRERFQPWQIVLSLFLAEIVFCFSEHRQETAYIVYNLVFLALYTMTILLSTSQKEPEPETVQPETEPLPEDEAPTAPTRRRITAQKCTSILLLVILGLETVANLANFGANFPVTDTTYYPRGKADSAAIIRVMKERERDTLFYRAETAYYQSLNDGALNGYDGVTTFTSSANLQTTLFMQALGYGAKNNYNRYYYVDGSPVGNLFLGLKYMLERNGNVKDNNYFDAVATQGDVSLLENNAYLPLGFLAGSALSEVEFTLDGDPFTFQNTLMRAAADLTQDVWHSIPTANLAITATSGIELDGREESRWCSYKGGGSVSFTYTADKAGLMCVHLNLSARNSFRILKNGEQVVSQSYSLPFMLAVSQVEPGDVIEVKMTCNSGSSGSMLVRAAVLDEERFRAAYDILSASTLELTHFESTLVEGKISCNRNGLLYLSIPQDGNWQAVVDRVPVEPVLVGECMIALPVTEGTHIVTLKYHNAAFSMGWKISLLCALVFLAAVYLRYKPRPVPQRGARGKNGANRKRKRK